MAYWLTAFIMLCEGATNNKIVLTCVEYMLV
nr:MAG TPA: hypothetical protein [Caudoviricetes sp.]